MDLNDMHLENKSKIAALDPVTDEHPIGQLDGDFADAVLKYANEHPERLDWRTFLRDELGTETNDNG